MIGHSPHSPSLSPSGREGENTVSKMVIETQSDAVYREMADKVMVEIARDLRSRQTDAENILWTALRNRKLNGMKFRRQHPIAGLAYVVDFLCYECKLAIELDGGIHTAQVEADTIRQQNIEEHGYKVIRFTNQQIINNLVDVLTTILKTGHLNFPLPEGEG